MPAGAVVTRGMTIAAAYPCCGKPCRLRIVAEAGRVVAREVVERRHFCEGDDVNGTLYRISWEEVGRGQGYRIHAVEFLDLASTDAVRTYGGTGRVPRRADRA